MLQAMQKKEAKTEIQGNRKFHWIQQNVNTRQQQLQRNNRNVNTRQQQLQRNNRNVNSLNCSNEVK